MQKKLAEFINHTQKWVFKMDKDLRVALIVFVTLVMVIITIKVALGYKLIAETDNETIIIEQICQPLNISEFNCTKILDLLHTKTIIINVTNNITIEKQYHDNLSTTVVRELNGTNYYTKGQVDSLLNKKLGDQQTIQDKEMEILKMEKDHEIEKLKILNDRDLPDFELFVKKDDQIFVNRDDVENMIDSRFRYENSNQGSLDNIMLWVIGAIVLVIGFIVFNKSGFQIPQFNKKKEKQIVEIENLIKNTENKLK
jgi:hypothetical protein